MGRKGGGKKTFLKGVVRADASELVSEQPAGQAAPTQPGDEIAQEHSGAATEAAAILSTQQAHQTKSQRLPTTASVADAPANGHADGAAEEAKPGAGRSETRGQLVQRHKKELKSHREAMKKLGKKNKEEVAKQDQRIEERHAAEMSALEQREAAEREGDSADDAAADVTKGLYDFRLNPAQEQAQKQPSKAQKRRQQRETRDAERAARIAAEQAEAGPSAKAEELSQLRAMLEPKGLVIREIQPDGHCMYKAVEDQLKLMAEEEEGDEAPGAAASAAPPAALSDFLQLRQRAADYMRAHKEQFLPFVQQDLPDEDGVDAAYDHYCTEVADTAAWGGQAELNALCNVLRVSIKVFAAGVGVVTMGQEYQGPDTAPLLVCYLRHAFGLGEHYNSLGFADDEEKEDPEQAFQEA